MDKAEILRWLNETDPARLGQLWRLADDARRQSAGDAVHLRGLVEISNHCRRNCHYCGIRSANVNLQRYRLSLDELANCAEQALSLGYGTLVLQAGEDPQLDRDWVCEAIERIRQVAPLAVTLSLGERDDADWRAWRQAGADRYLLRFETSDRQLYERIHPSAGGRHFYRIAALRRLRDIGYEIGSGVMIGIPGQTYSSLADDIAMFDELALDMIGVGPFIPHPDTPLGAGGAVSTNGDSQVPADELTTYKVIAMARLIRPAANIPATTALASLNQSQGRELGLQRGANVVMPNITPLSRRALYHIYPAKACLGEQPGEFHRRLVRSIVSIGRCVGAGRGDSPSYMARANLASGR